jgi:hypothetical protein
MAGMSRRSALAIGFVSFGAGACSGSTAISNPRAHTPGIAMAAPSEPAPAPRAVPAAITKMVARAGERVLAAARALELSSRGADDWTIRIDPSLRSPFLAADACTPVNADEPTTLCHQDGATTVCSLTALETLIAIRLGDLPTVCGGTHRENDVPDLERLGDDAVVALYFVLAHELGHLEKSHELNLGGANFVASGDQATRLRRLRKAVQGAPKQLAVEAEADTFAGDVVRWLIERSIESNAPEHATYVRLAHTTALRTAFSCLDEATRCRWDDRIQLPPERTYVLAHASALACEAVRAPEGKLMPVVRGTHDDWAARMSAIHGLGEAEPVEPASGGLGALLEVANATDDVFVFWEKHSGEYYRELADAVGQVTLDFVPDSCDSLPDLRSGDSE